MKKWEQLRSSSNKSYAVIGLGFGDEGKGLTVNSLCKVLKRPLVVRYSGGQQAGHTVTIDKDCSHIFSNFGSGSFQGAETFWSKHCSFDPVGVQREFNIFRKKNGAPRLYVDKNSPVTTPYDKNYNKNFSQAMKHGTCGVGVGATFKREQDNCSLVANDLLFPSVVAIKLTAIRNYYVAKCGMIAVTAEQLEGFHNACKFVRENREISIGHGSLVGAHENIIFEGSQGLMLDQNFGFFPHVTPSNTGTKNILELGSFNDVHSFLVTRAYQTRHGNGPMTNEHLGNDFITPNPRETNVQNDYQGSFRRTMLDLNLLKYAISRDDHLKTTYHKTLVVTCLDQMKDFCYTVDGNVVSHADAKSFLKSISYYLEIPHVLACSNPEGIFEEYQF